MKCSAEDYSEKRGRITDFGKLKFCYKQNKKVITTPITDVNLRNNKLKMFLAQKTVFLNPLQNLREINHNGERLQ